MGAGVEVEPDWRLAAQPAPDYEVDQRIHWCGGKPALQTHCGEAACGAPGAPEITLLGKDFLVVNLAGSALLRES